MRVSLLAQHLLLRLPMRKSAPHVFSLAARLALTFLSTLPLAACGNSDFCSSVRLGTNISRYSSFHETKDTPDPGELFDQGTTGAWCCSAAPSAASCSRSCPCSTDCSQPPYNQAGLLYYAQSDSFGFPDDFPNQCYVWTDENGVVLATAQYEEHG